MDTTLLGPTRQPLTPIYVARRAAQLRKRGYSKNEVLEIHRRATEWMAIEVPPDPVSGRPQFLCRDYSAALAEVLSDSADIAAGLFA